MTAALQRVQSELTRPGVRLRRHKDVPLYFVAPDRPGVFIRVLNGKRDKGVLENGHFKVID